MEELGWCFCSRQPRYLKVSLTHMANTIEIIKVPIKITPELKIKIVKLVAITLNIKSSMATMPDAV